MSEYIEPQRKLSHLRSLQMKVKELTFMIEDLKKGLEEDYKNKKISSKFSFAGINATRNRKPEKWQYSTNLLDYENYKKVFVRSYECDRAKTDNCL